MLNRKMRITALSLAMSLAVSGLATGCGSLKKEPIETESETQPQTMTETEKETETEPETELQTNVAYTSQDKSIRITLPDSTWSVTQDADEMRVFSAGSEAMINIVHAADAAAVGKLSVAETEQELTESLAKQYPDSNAFEVVDFEALSSTTLDTYEYVVKYNETSMWFYVVTYGIIAEDEAYVITGTVQKDNKVLLDAVQKSVESFTVLRSSKFSVLPGTTANATGSESATTQSESGAEAELESLTDYGTSATLYTSDTVNVRLQPSTETDIMTTLVPGTQVTVVGETSQWFKVNINGNVGYINKAFLVNNPSAAQSETTQSSDSSQVSDETKTTAELNSYVDYGTSYTYYTTTDVNLRAQPGTDSGIVTSVAPGASVSVIGETDNWFVVSVNGSTGYISKSYISSTQPSTGGNNGSTNTGGTNTGGTDNSGGSTNNSTGTPTSGTGTVSGTIVGANANTITIQGDDGNTYNINYTDASVSTSDGFQNGLYVTATVDYSGTSPTGELYATNVSGH